MKLSLSPVRRDDTLSLARKGDALIINGETFDFAPLAEGAVLPPEAIASDWFAGPVTRSDGALHIALFLPHGPDAPRRTLFPEVIDDPADGVVTLPPHSKEVI